MADQALEYHTNHRTCSRRCRELTEVITSELCPGENSSSSSGKSCFYPTQPGITEIHTVDLSDEIMDNYVIFSFVRDPLARIASAHHEASPCTDKEVTKCGDFLPMLHGVSSNQKNPHYLSQAYQLLNMRSRSGHRMRLDFVGRLEHFDADIARLKETIDPHYRLLSPQERLRRVSDASGAAAGGSGGSGAADHPHLKAMRQSADDPRFTTHGKGPASFTALHVVLACRRYIQDFLCFGYGVPRACIEHADKVVAMCGGVCAPKSTGATATRHKQKTATKRRFYDY